MQYEHHSLTNKLLEGKGAVTKIAAGNTQRYCAEKPRMPPFNAPGTGDRTDRARGARIP